MLKFINLFFLFIAVSLPADHSGTTLVFSISILGVKFLYTDLFFIFLSISNLFLKKQFNLVDVSIFFFILFFFGASYILSILNSYSFKQVLYDFRPIIYLSVLTFDKRLFNFKDLTIFFTVVIALFLYSVICFSYFIFDSQNLLIFENVNLGRIVFHNDYFLIIGIPFVFYGIIKAEFNRIIKFGLVIILVSFLLKLFLSMGRGITFFVCFTIILIFYKDFSNFKLKAFLFYFVLLIPLFYVYNLASGLLLGESSDIFIEYALSRYDSSGEGFKENQIDNRSTMVITGIRKFLDSPFIGHGAGYTFNIDSKEWDDNVSFVDSSFITSLIRYGVIGTFILYTILISISVIIFKRRNFSKMVYKISLFRILSIALLIIFIYSFFNSLLVSSYSIVGFYWLLSWLLNYYNNNVILER